jgi:GT2 family glycosyltransferase
VVADNGSPDDSITFVRARYPQIELIDLEQNWGFAEGYNRALKQVDAQFYVILNSDVEVTPHWTRPILDAMRNDPTIGIAQPKILAEQRRDRFEHAGAAGGWVDYLGYPFCRGRIFNYVEQDKGQYDEPQACFWAAGAAYFIRAEVYHQFGGFDADYFAHNEEIDLCWRIKRAGYSVWCFPQSTVYHLGGGTLGYESPRKVFLNFRNSLFTLLKNESVPKLCWLIPARLVLDGLAGGMFLVKGQYAAITAIIKSHFSFYNQFFRFLKKRQEVAKIVKKHQLPGKKADKSGVYPVSIVFAHYLRRVKAYSDLPFVERKKR